jgi:hypothetical protein
MEPKGKSNEVLVTEQLQFTIAGSNYVSVSLQTCYVYFSCRAQFLKTCINKNENSIGIEYA